MTPKQTTLVNQAATKEVSGEQWRKRMERWIKTFPKPGNRGWVQTFVGTWNVSSLAGRKLDAKIKGDRKKDIALLDKLLGHA